MEPHGRRRSPLFKPPGFGEPPLPMQQRSIVNQTSLLPSPIPLFPGPRPRFPHDSGGQQFAPPLPPYGHGAFPADRDDRVLMGRDYHPMEHSEPQPSHFSREEHRGFPPPPYQQRDARQQQNDNGGGIAEFGEPFEQRREEPNQFRPAVFGVPPEPPPYRSIPQGDNRREGNGRVEGPSSYGEPAPSSNGAEPGYYRREETEQRQQNTGRRAEEPDRRDRTDRSDRQRRDHEDDGYRRDRPRFEDNRDSRSSRDRVRSRSRERERDRDGNWERESRSGENRVNRGFSSRNAPCAICIMKGLPIDIEEGTIWDLLAKQGFRPKDVRLLRKGFSRGFGFVEFRDVPEATRWLEYTNGCLELGDRERAQLDYSHPMQPASEQQQQQQLPSGIIPPKAPFPPDWTCKECRASNFRRRDKCFKCGKAKAAVCDDTEENSFEGFADVGVVQCDTLLLRGLAKTTAEDQVQVDVQKLTGNLPKQVIVVRDLGAQFSRGYAYVEFVDSRTAAATLSRLQGASSGVKIDGKEILVSYCRRRLEDILNPAQPSNNTLQSNSANAAAALAQDAMQKATTARQVKNAVMQEQLKTVQQLQLAAAAQQSSASLAMIPTAAGLMLQQAAAPALTLQQQLLGLAGNNLLQQQQQQQQQLNSSLMALTGAPAITSNAAQAQIASAVIANQQQQQIQQLQQQQRIAALQAEMLRQSTPAVSENAAAAATKPGDLGTVKTPHGEYPIYPAPDRASFQYEPTSGLYYDPVSTYYFDSNSQYYYNGNTQKYLYWDAQYSTFLPVTDESAAAGAGGSKVEKAEKVKTAKKIQKDMERWAKQLNQKKDVRKPVAEPAPETQVELEPQLKGATVDLAYNSVLEQAVKSGQSLLSCLVNPDEDALESSSSNSFNFPSSQQSATREQQPDSEADVNLRFADWERMVCLLCQRKFPSREVLTKHQQLSELHKKNLADHLAMENASTSTQPRVAADSPAGSAFQQSAQTRYRDRAKERRDKFGLEDAAPPNKFRERFMQDNDYEQPTATGLGEDNVGNQLLRGMGWQAGQGLGRANQGIVDPVKAQNYQTGVGFGSTSEDVFRRAR